MKLKAMRTFEGNEGLIRRGDTFTAEGTERGEYLITLGLAEKADPGSEVTNVQQKIQEFDGMKKDELVKYAEENGVSYPDGATKDEIKNAIVSYSEKQYLADQAAGTPLTGSGTAPGTAAGSTPAAGAATGAATTGSTNTGQGGAAAAGGNTGGSTTGAAGTGAAGGTV